jgi:hypothetical protein
VLCQSVGQGGAPVQTTPASKPTPTSTALRNKHHGSTSTVLRYKNHREQKGDTHNAYTSVYIGKFASLHIVEIHMFFACTELNK